MVKVYDITTPKSVDDENFAHWCQSIQPKEEKNSHKLWENLSSILVKLVSKTEQTANTAEETFKLDDLFAQGFEMANILSSLGANSKTLIAAILYPFVDTKLIGLQEIESQCDRVVSARVRGVRSMSAIRALQADFSHSNTAEQDATQIDNLRKMLLTMVDDVRVVLIKLAERLYLLRKAVKAIDLERMEIAQEVSDVYAPLANRLGVGQLKWEMEDLAFRILHEDQYMKIAKSLDEKRGDREVYVKSVLSEIGSQLEPFGIKGDLQGRAKHIFSIWRKMQKKQVGFEEIYDVRAVRVLVPEVRDCYSVLGVVHGLWKHIPKEFDDYIATPKENGYRSLHTAVVGPEGKTIEIQIRTFEMHQESELGVAAHWKYKEGKGAPADGYEAKIAWLRQLLDWQDELSDSADIVGDFKNQVLEDRVYVFTPQGRLIDLPQGSTPVDFAYRVHTEVGHRCKGAKVNGKIVPLTQGLSTGQKVEILTDKNGEPSRDWLVEERGYIQSSRARAKILQWFKHQNKDKNASVGKTLLEKELVKNNLQGIDYLKIAQHFNFKTEVELFASIGSGDKGTHQVINHIRSTHEKAKNEAQPKVIKRKSAQKSSDASGDILVQGVGNLLTQMAGCCTPVPGDEIAGYITQGRGIMIHRADCRYLLASQKRSPQKVLAVDWNHEVADHYLIDLKVKAYDRKGLLGDITSLFSDEKINVTALNAQKLKKQLMVAVNIQIEVDSINIVSRILTKLEHLDSVVSAQRNA